MRLQVDKCDGGYAVRRGPLVYALRIGEDWREPGKPWPDFAVPQESTEREMKFNSPSFTMRPALHAPQVPISAGFSLNLRPAHLTSTYTSHEIGRILWDVAN